MNPSSITQPHATDGATFVRRKDELRAALAPARAAGRTIGLVPTMGFLHEGHLSLLRAAREQCDVVVMSLFVNPTQFGPGEDLEHYPRDEERDARLASEAGVDLVYAPPVEEVYPEGFSTAVEVEGLTEVLDGDPGAARAGALPRRHDRRRQALQHGPARRRLLRPEGRPAAGGHPAHGPRPRHPGPDRGPAHRSRGRRAGDELAKRLSGLRGAGARRGALPGAARSRRARPGGVSAGGDRRGPRRARGRAGSSPSTWRRATPTTSPRSAELNGRPVLLAVAARVGGARLIDNVLIQPTTAITQTREA